VQLEDQTVLRSEEEILKSPIPILDMVKTDDRVRIRFKDQTEAQNFYLSHIEIFDDGELITNLWDVFNDDVITENMEESLIIDGIKDGQTVKITAYTINFNTFQFYSNVFKTESDLLLASLIPPINLEGNIINSSTNQLALGNFGIAGFSTMTMDF